MHPREILAHLEAMRAEAPQRVGYLWAPKGAEEVKEPQEAAQAQEVGA